MKNLNKSLPSSGNVSMGGGVHSFAVSYLKKAGGKITARDLGVPFFYVCPLVEEAIKVRPLNNEELVDVPLDMIEMNIGIFLPIQVIEIESTSEHLLGL